MKEIESARTKNKILIWQKRHSKQMVKIITYELQAAMAYVLLMNTEVVYLLLTNKTMSHPHTPTVLITNRPLTRTTMTYALLMNTAVAYLLLTSTPISHPTLLLLRSQ